MSKLRMPEVVISLLMLATMASGQTNIRINVGGPPIGTYSSDTVCGGVIFAVPSQAGIYSTLKYGLSFSCDVPAPNGSCIATLDLIENRAAGPNPATQSGIGTRVFAVASQGVLAPPVDIFAAVGALTPYQLRLPAAEVTDGHLRLSLLASKGNAVLSGLDISCTAAPPVSLNCIAPVTCTFDPGANQWTVTIAAANPCPTETADTIRAIWSKLVTVELAHQSSIGLLDCIPDQGILTVIVDQSGIPLGVYVPDPQNMALIPSRDQLHVFNIWPLQNNLEQ